MTPGYTFIYTHMDFIRTRRRPCARRPAGGPEPPKTRGGSARRTARTAAGSDGPGRVSREAASAPAARRRAPPSSTAAAAACRDAGGVWDIRVEDHSGDPSGRAAGLRRHRRCRRPGTSPSRGQRRGASQRVPGRAPAGARTREVGWGHTPWGTPWRISILAQSAAAGWPGRGLRGAAATRGRGPRAADSARPHFPWVRGRPRWERRREALPVSHDSTGPPRPRRRGRHGLLQPNGRSAANVV